VVEAEREREREACLDEIARELESKGSLAGRGEREAGGRMHACSCVCVNWTVITCLVGRGHGRAYGEIEDRTRSRCEEKEGERERENSRWSVSSAVTSSARSPL
jgi:hypothetical protein